MALIHVINFGGLIPRVSDRLLPNEAATIATNTKMYSGELRSWRTPLPVTNLGDSAVSAYKLVYNDEDVWMHWNADTDVVRAPV